MMAADNGRAMLVSKMMAPESGRADPGDKYRKKGGRAPKYIGHSDNGAEHPSIVPDAPFSSVRHRLLSPSALDPACVHCQQVVATAPYYHCLACSRRVCMACEAAERHDPAHVLASIRIMV